MQIPVGLNAGAPDPTGASPFHAGNTPFDAIGGEARVRALVDAFYARMDREAAYAGIRALHKPDLSDAREKLRMFLCGWLGGPQLYIERFGHPRLRARHQPFPIGDNERDQWLACMAATMDELGIQSDLRPFLDSRFRHVADFMRNQ
jgi:hemoglobin